MNARSTALRDVELMKAEVAYRERALEELHLSVETRNELRGEIQTRRYMIEKLEDMIPAWRKP